MTAKQRHEIARHHSPARLRCAPRRRAAQHAPGTSFLPLHSGVNGRAIHPIPISGSDAARDGDRRDQEHRDSDYDLNDHRALPRTSAASLRPRRSLRVKGSRAARVQSLQTTSGNSILSRRISRGPGATPAGHVWLPTHREVMTASQRISAFGLLVPPLGSRAFSCVSAFHAAARTIFLRGKPAIWNPAQGVHARGFRWLAGRCGGSPDGESPAAAEAGRAMFRAGYAGLQRHEGAQHRMDLGRHWRCALRRTDGRWCRPLKSRPQSTMTTQVRGQRLQRLSWHEGRLHDFGFIRCRRLHRRSYLLRGRAPWCGRRRPTAFDSCCRQSRATVLRCG